MDLDGDSLILFSSILDFGKGSDALKLSEELGAIGGTIFLGKGTVRVQWLNVLGAYDIRKEILVAIIDKGHEDELYNRMTEKFTLNKPHKGIAFSMPLKDCLNIKDSKNIFKPKGKDVKGMDYEAIFIIVNKGLSSDVLEAAESASSTGGTVIHGRGSGTRAKARLFNIEIEPEKDIVLILSKTEQTDSIVKAIGERLNISEPTRGIIFVMDVTRAVGLYNKKE